MSSDKKTLYRLPKEGKIFGVCAGLADYFEIDVTLMRIIFVVLTLATGGAMFVVYLILSIIMPTPGSKEGTIDEKIHQLGKDFNDNKAINVTRNYVGIGLILLGAWILAYQFFPNIFNFDWSYVWPVALILIGLFIVVRRGYERNE